MNAILQKKLWSIKYFGIKIIFVGTVRKINIDDDQISRIDLVCLEEDCFYDNVSSFWQYRLQHISSLTPLSSRKNMLMKHIRLKQHAIHFYHVQCDHLHLLSTFTTSAALLFRWQYCKFGPNQQNWHFHRLNES